tara:strand:+ start:192 stop:374 length:183 start_codon:yes stop_codon:yes gene_type:complete
MNMDNHMEEKIERNIDDFYYKSITYFYYFMGYIGQISNDITNYFSNFFIKENKEINKKDF